MTNRNDVVNSILDLRDEIKENLSKIDNLLQIHFPSEYSNAYQHWIPQVLTALYNDLKWLPRGQMTLQDSIDRIKDSDDDSCGVSKFIK